MSSCVQIVGVGHCCQDNICVVENYPVEDGSTHILSMYDRYGGGAVATALVAASSLGTSTAMLANLGDDTTGQKIISGFKDARVDTKFINIIPNGRSSSSIVMVNCKNGSRTKFPYRDNLPNIEFGEKEINLIKNASAIHLDGTNYQNAVSAADIAKNTNTLISLDACSRQKDNNLNVHLATMANIFISNATYPMAVTKCSSNEEALLEISKLGNKQVVICTLGADGVLAVIDGRVEHVPAFKVDAIDTTGAGDVFHGAFLTAWLEDKDILESIKFASATSALKCLKPGGRSGIPSRADVNRFLASQNL